MAVVLVQAASPRRERKRSWGAQPSARGCGIVAEAEVAPSPVRRASLGQTQAMAKYVVNRRGVAKARELIDKRQYRIRSRWTDVQPNAAEQNSFLKDHGWAEYGSWHLALTDG